MFLGYDISSIELLIVSETVFETLKTLSKHQRVITEESKACVSPREHLLHLRIQMFRVQVNPPSLPARPIVKYEQPQAGTDPVPMKTSKPAETEFLSLAKPHPEINISYF